MSVSENGAKPYYFVPQPSYWPITGSCALLCMAFGAAFWFNAYAFGPWLVLFGFCILLTMLFGWFGRVIDESEHRLYNKKVDVSFRWGMSWFIFSEVMFFAAFFGALGYIRLYSVPDLGSLE
ncbi:MAG TPA: cytochrome c oxidase subunit 3, partial [Casimicrobiaceae bacterium]|nr:cytochrome c oxidase subunit 3 [Casimicrobiaceae bacterium]